MYCASWSIVLSGPLTELLLAFSGQLCIATENVTFIKTFPSHGQTWTWLQSSCKCLDNFMSFSQLKYKLISLCLFIQTHTHIKCKVACQLPFISFCLFQFAALLCGSAKWTRKPPNKILLTSSKSLARLSLSMWVEFLSTWALECSLN